MTKIKGKEAAEDSLIPWYAVGLVAIICAAALVLIAVLGPAMLGIVHYRTSIGGFGRHRHLTLQI